MPGGHCPQRRQHGKGTLAHLVAKPGPTNAARLETFQKILKTLLDKTPTWKRRKEPFMRQVVEWQMWFLQSTFSDLKKKRAPEVKGEDLHGYVWDVR